MKKNSPTTQSYPRTPSLLAGLNFASGLDKGTIGGIVKHGKTGWVEATDKGFIE